MEDTSCSASATKSLPTGVGLEGLPRQKSRQHSLHSSKSTTLGTRSLPREFTTMPGEVSFALLKKNLLDTSKLFPRAVVLCIFLSLLFFPTMMFLKLRQISSL